MFAARNMLFARVAVSGMDADADALIAAMTTAPDSTRSALITTTFTNLKAAGIWAKLDDLVFLSAHAQQASLLKWKSRAACSLIGTPAFVVDRGWTGDLSITKAINLNFIPSIAGGSFAQNSASFGTYLRTDRNAVENDIGCREASASRQTLILARNGGNFIVRVNQDSNTGTSNAVATSLGLFCANRSGATALQSYRNGAEVGTATAASNGLPAYSMYMLAINQAGTVTNPSLRQNAFGFWGGSLTATEHSDLYTIVQAYMTAVGANV